MRLGEVDRREAICRPSYFGISKAKLEYPWNAAPGGYATQFLPIATLARFAGADDGREPGLDWNDIPALGRKAPAMSDMPIASSKYWPKEPLFHVKGSLMCRDFLADRRFSFRAVSPNNPKGDSIHAPQGVDRDDSLPRQSAPFDILSINVSIGAGRSFS